ncbi:MAG: hypothetical protein LBC39_06530 [Methanobrevibacter sp.]|jgi:hypothetical protein|nr:hypothetical protein [Candidatus Methanovirga aequatorialis]
MDEKRKLKLNGFLDNEEFDNNKLDKNSVDDLNSYPNSNDDFSTNTNYYNYFHVHDQNFNEEYSNVIPLRRLVLSFILSFGLYGYYWFYKNISYLKERHNLPIDVKFRTLVYILVPLGNFIVLYDLINTMKYHIEKKGIKPYSPILNLLGFIVFGFSPLGIWFYVNVQESFNEYWRLEQIHLSIKRNFSSAEIAIIFFVWLLILILMVFIGYFLTHYRITFPNQ